MLVFTRKRGQAILMGDDIEIVVLGLGRENVRLGVRAPLTVPVYRKEIYVLISEENRSAAGSWCGARPAPGTAPLSDSHAARRADER